jgi:CheY-like chemotaxis protein
LATVYGVVKQNNGYIDVLSEPGSGTIFTIYLPRTNEIIEDARAETDANALRGGETILVAEDEESIARLTEGILARLGYTVLVAHTPGEALALAEQRIDQIQLLLTDVVMPEMNGRELFERLSSLRSGMRVLFMSGYTADIISQRGVIEEGTQFIQKPFSMRVIASRVREVLDRK